MIAGRGYVLYRYGDGRGTGGRRKRALAVLKRRDALLKDVGGGVHKPRIDVPRLREPKAPSRLGGIFKDVRGGGVNRHCARIRGRIGPFLSDMQLQSLEFVIFTAHFIKLPFD